MTADYHPPLTLLLSFGGWVNREQSRTIAYLVEGHRRDSRPQVLPAFLQRSGDSKTLDS